MTQDEAHGARAAALLAIALLGLLALAERAGLPSEWTRGFFGAIAVLALGSVLTFARTSRERPFLGLEPVASPAAGAAALVAAIWIVGDAIAPARDAGSWLASLLGAPAGLAVAHAAARFAMRRAGGDGSAGPAVDRLAPLRGLVLLAAAGAGALLSARVAAVEAARIVGIDEEAAVALVLGVALAAVLVGGARGAVSLAAAAAAAAAAGFATLLAAGAASIGTLPLPGQSEQDTLMAIAGARERWGIAAPLHLMEWPPFALAFQGDAPAAFGLSFAAAAALAIAAWPAVPIHRRSTAATAAAALALLPLVLTAIAGYAVEAAATRFIGAPIARPPAALLEAARMGLVAVCGAYPDTAEALRAACGVGPRDASVFVWGQIAPSQAFLEGGLAAALGFPQTIGFALGGVKLALALAATAFGLWIAARALGRDILGRRRRAAGLASLRLGLMRLSAVLLAAGAAAALLAHAEAAPYRVWAGCFGGAAVLLLVDTLWRAFRPRAEPLEEAAAPRPLPRRRKKAAVEPASAEPDGA